MVDVREVEKAFGKKLVGCKDNDAEFWLIFDDGSILRYVYGALFFSCVNCEEKKKL